MERLFYKQGEGGEVDRGRVLELPCVLGSLSSLRGGEGLILVKLLVPNNGTAAWVSKQDVTILAQSAAGGGALRALVKSTVIDEDEKAYVVEIVDRNHPRRIQVPKVWLKREPRRQTGAKPIQS